MGFWISSLLGEKVSSMFQTCTQLSFYTTSRRQLYRVKYVCFLPQILPALLVVDRYRIHENGVPQVNVYDGLRCHSNGYLGKFPPINPIIYAPYIHNYPYCCCLNLIKSHCIPICFRKYLHVGWIHPTICMFSWTQTLNIPPKKNK